MDEAARRAAAARRQARYRERQKVRAKAHAEGDHSSCDPGVCEAAPDPVVAVERVSAGDVGEGVTGDVMPPSENPVSHREPPAGLRDRGGRLWEEMAGLKLGPAHVLLLERTCRMADRQARLDEVLEGRDWIELVEVPGTGGGVVRVVLDRALSEIRQHDIALKLLVAELRHAGRPAPAAGTAPPAEAPAGGQRPQEGGAAGGNVRSLAAIRNRSPGG